MPSCANSTGGGPPGGDSGSKAHRAPLPSEVPHSASRTFTTNQPSVTGARPEPKSSSRASRTARIYWWTQAIVRSIAYFRRVAGPRDDLTSAAVAAAFAVASGEGGRVVEPRVIGRGGNR